MPGIAERIRTAWGALLGAEWTADGLVKIGHGSSLEGAPPGITGLFSRGMPPRRGSRQLLAAYRQSPWLRAVTHKIALSTASTRWRLFSARAKRGRKYYRCLEAQRAPNQDAQRRILKDLHDVGELEEITVHPLLDLLATANPTMTGMTGRQVTQLLLDLLGEAYWVLGRNSAGAPVEFWPIPPTWVLEIPTKNNPNFRMQFGDWNGLVPAEEVLVFRDPNPENPYGRGVGLAESLADEIDTDEHAAKHVSSFFYNQGMPTFIAGVKGASEEQLKAASKRWEAKFLGFRKAHRTAWQNGEISITRLDTSFKDMKLIELRKFQRDMIIQIFGVSPEILGVIENSNRATAEAGEYQFAKFVDEPRVELQRATMQARLVPEYDERLILVFDSKIPADKEFNHEVAKSFPHAFKVNEIRAMAGQPPIDDGDLFVVGLDKVSVASLADLGAGAAPAADTPEKTVKMLPAHIKVSEGSIEGILDEAFAENRMEEELTATLEAVIASFGTTELETLAVGGAFDLLNPDTVRFLEEFAADKIVGIDDFTRARIRKVLLEGVTEGEGVRDLQRRIRKEMGSMTAVRAQRIARTEVVGASNHGVFTAQKLSGVVRERQWLATLINTRDTHLRLNLAIQDIGEPFVVDGNEAMHPGGFGVASEDINCMCTTIAVISDPVPIERGAEMWRAYVQRAAPWEDRVRAAARRAFRANLRDLLDAVSRFG